MHNNRYIFIYSAVMVVVVAIALTVVAVKLKPAQENNIRIEKMQNILAAVNVATTTQNAQDLFKKFITQQIVVNNKGEELQGEEAFKIDMVLELKKPADNRNLPVYICTQENGEKNYIVPLRGKGLWGPIWGYVAFKSDFNTIVGTMFDHKGETPGLGAEINTPIFQKQFPGKQIFDVDGKFVSVDVKKGGAAPDDIHGVDAISGGTITSNGLSSMLHDCLLEYQSYFKKQSQL